MFEKRKTQKIISEFNRFSPQEQGEALEKLCSFGKVVFPFLIESLRRNRIILHDGKRILLKLYKKDYLNDYIQMLNEPRADIRGMVKEVIIEKGGQGAVPTLMDNFDNPGFQIRNSATDVLAKLSTQNLVSKLSKYLNHSQKDVRKNAIELLGRIGGDEAIKNLTALFSNDDWWLRRKAVEAICVTKDTKAVPPLVELLKKEKDPVLVKCILDTFSVIGDERVVSTVLPYLSDSDMITRQKAVDILGKFARAEHVRDLMSLMQASDVNVRRSAVEVLNLIRDPNAGKVLIRCIKDSDWWVREIATDALADISGQNVNRLISDLLNDEDEYIRRSAVEYFNRVKYAPAFKPLIKLLADKDWWVREKAMTALAKFKDPRIIPYVMKLVRDKEIKWVIPQVLGQIGAKEGLPHLISLMGDEDREVRMSALKSMQMIDHPDVIAPLKEATTHPDEEIAKTAREILKSKTVKADPWE